MDGDTAADAGAGGVGSGGAGAGAGVGVASAGAVVRVKRARTGPYVRRRADSMNAASGSTSSDPNRSGSSPNCRFAPRPCALILARELDVTLVKNEG